MKNVRFLALGLAAAAAMTFASGSASADGEKVFKTRQCITCHTLDGKAKVGPSLKGMFGRKAGTDAGFSGKYSKDMVAAGEKGLEWNDETFAKYIKPEADGGLKVFIGGLVGKPKADTKMVFNGLKDDAEVKELIEYIKAAK